MGSAECSSEKRVARWYFGGMAAMGAAVFTHPLDLLKVHLQTVTTPATGSSLGSQTVKPSLFSTTAHIVRKQGTLALYNGLSASLLRQLTYSTTRFAIYETIKKRLVEKEMRVDQKGALNIPFFQKLFLAAISGAAGGLVGAPADMINVRMQNDIKLPLENRRNYKHAIDGLIRVQKYEGARSLFNGASMATFRGVLVTIGQLSMYDQFKFLLMKYASDFFGDDLLTHFTASLTAAGVATTLTQPLDVMKTRLMSASKGEYTSILHCSSQIFRESGPLGFFKGYKDVLGKYYLPIVLAGFVPAFVRLGPHTVLMFIFFEQLRINFGDSPKVR